MTERPDGQVSLFDQDTWYGKMWQEHSAQTKAVTSRQSSKKQSASQSRKLPTFKCLTRDGRLGGVQGRGRTMERGLARARRAMVGSAPTPP